MSLIDDKCDGGCGKVFDMMGDPTVHRGEGYSLYCDTCWRARGEGDRYGWISAAAADGYPGEGPNPLIKPTLTEFLLARITEDEEGLCHCCDDGLGTQIGFARAELDAKRRIVEDCADAWGSQLHAEWGQVMRGGLDRACRLMAAPYADHPDYREEWKP